MRLGDGATRSADELVKGVLVSGGIPPACRRADGRLCFVDLDAPATPAGRKDHQRDAVLIVGEECMKVSAEGSLRDLHG